MIVGNKERFGIEFEMDAAKLADPKLAEWKYGRIRWWCGAEEVGRYEADTTVRDVSVEAGRLLSNEGKRQDEKLIGASSEEVVRTLVDALDALDEWDIFLIEGEKSARLVWRRVKDTKVRERELAPGEFDAVLRQFLDALGEASREGGRPA